VTATGAPNDDYNSLQIAIVVGGTIGTTGITLTYSLDNGATVSAPQALGTATSFTVPNTGVAFAFAAGTVLAGQTETTACTGPRMSTTDVTNALEALRTSSQAWEMVTMRREQPSP
jgi:hypothetical protein